jgi:hypothetical protein
LVYVDIDLFYEYTLGVFGLCLFSLFRGSFQGVSDMNDPLPDFKPLNNGFGIQPIGNPPGMEKGDVHETFQADQAGNVSNGHTTVRLPGDLSVQLPWSP